MQFVVKCYLEELHNRVRDMKSELGRENGELAHDRKENLDTESGLRTWLGKSSPQDVLRWFDAHKTFEVSSEIRKRK